MCLPYFWLPLPEGELDEGWGPLQLCLLFSVATQTLTRTGYKVLVEWKDLALKKYFPDSLIQ